MIDDKDIVRNVGRGAGLLWGKSDGGIPEIVTYVFIYLKRDYCEGTLSCLRANFRSFDLNAPCRGGVPVEII